MIPPTLPNHSQAMDLKMADRYRKRKWDLVRRQIKKLDTYSFSAGAIPITLHQLIHLSQEIKTRPFFG